MEIKRKLASYRRISAVDSIPNADNLEVVTVDGWKVVTKKGEFKPGDGCIYFELDSFLPVWPCYEFLRKSSYRSVENYGEGFRIKTAKLRGQISQGLVMKPEDIGGTVADAIIYDSTMPFDLTDVLEVRKWDPPIGAAQLAGDVAGRFPSDVPKTDQERVQNILGYINQHHHDDTFEVSLKLDGASMTVFFNNGKFGVCSRNWELKPSDDNTYWQVARKLDLEKKLTAFGFNFAIQGELMGPGIQKNREALKEHTFYVFDIYDIDTQTYLPSDKRMWVTSLLGLKDVPIVSFDMKPKETIDEYLALADCPSISHPIAEGVVFKSNEHPEFSFKVINNNYLLKCED